MKPLRQIIPLFEDERLAPTHPKLDLYKNHTEHVPITWLMKLHGNKLRHDVHELTADIQKHGLKEPLIINVGKTSRTAALGEGNHRLAALIHLGYTHAPTRVIVGSNYGSEHHNQHRFDHDIIPKHGEYFSADAKPSEVFHSLKGHVK